MDARRGLVAVALLILTAPALAQPPGRLIPLEVRDGRCEAVLDTGRAGDQFFLIVGSLAPGLGQHRVLVHTGATDSQVSLPLDTFSPDPAWVRRVAEMQDRLERARRQRAAPAEYRQAADPPRRRTFHLFTGDGNFDDPGGYVAVAAELRGIGRHCQVYVDQACPDPAALQQAVNDVVAAFDGRIYPETSARFGQALDVDRDGRFTVLFTGWLGRLSGGKVAVGGFVRGSDFYRDLQPPFGNRCDLLYLNTDLRPGPHLRSLLAHEYTHAVVFSERVFGGYPGEGGGREEEGWLNEGLAHLAEDLHGAGWSNLDYRISAYLSAPARYPLVVPDYYGPGLWRTPGVRGAAYLFLRWVADRHGADVARRLTQTGQCGVANLETATGERFADLFRLWTAAVALGGSGITADGTTPLDRIDLRQPLGGRLLCGPHFENMPLDGGRQDVLLAGTSAGYLLLHTPGGPHSRLTITAEAGTELQVSLIRLPERTARLSLRLEEGPTPGTVRPVVTAHNGDVTLTAAAWERLAPAGRAEDTNYRRDGTPGERVRAWLGNPMLRAGNSRVGTPVALPSGEGAWVIKLVGSDTSGHVLAAWEGVGRRREEQISAAGHR